jgi:MoxR-like ATPase
MPYTTKVIDGSNPFIMTKTVEISELQQRFGNTVTAPQLQEYAAEMGTTYQTLSKKLANYKTGRGVWTLEVEKLEENFASPAVDPVREIKSYVPAKDASFVPFGNFADLKKIIQSKQFYPIFITGLSGNGKTFGVEQACAQLKRELIRVNITIETDEDDLIGGFRLVNGETVWHNGPVIEAMQRGAVLLLDEVDLASNKILCLQSILEGSGLYLKKTGKYVIPADGFSVVATANTKGKGSDDGRFIGTNVLNEAFLERFPITFEQDYPAEKTEVKIVSQALDGQDDDFAEKLVRWAQVIRKTFYDGGVDEVISTRRLVHIAKAYKIFGKRDKAIEVCVNRFDADTKQSFLDLYSKVDEKVETTVDEQAPF